MLLKKCRHCAAFFFACIGSIRVYLLGWSLRAVIEETKSGALMIKNAILRLLLQQFCLPICLKLI
jgi:hypothetical protein